MATDAKTRALQVLETLYPDPTARAARQEELGDTGLMTLGNHVLRQDEFSRNMNDLGAQKAAAAAAQAEYEALHGANTAWFEEHKNDLVELDRLKAQVGGRLPDPTKPAGDPKLVTAEALAATLADTERGAVAFINDLTDLKFQHFQQFGEVLDTTKLLQDKRVQQIGLLGVYREVHKPQLDARAAKLAADAEEKIRADERQKMAVSQASQHHPYPVRGNEPSTLDRFERTSDQAPKVATVDDMVNEYARLSAGRSGVSV
jgi:hypothetical protein